MFSCEFYEIFKNSFSEHLWWLLLLFVINICFTYYFNPFHVTGLLLCPLKKSENLWFLNVFGRYRRNQVTWNGLNLSSTQRCFLAFYLELKTLFTILTKIPIFMHFTLIGRLAVVGRVLWIRVCPSFRPEVFFETGSLVFSETQHGVKGPCVAVRDSQIFWKKYFCPKNGENGPKMGKN